MSKNRIKILFIHPSLSIGGAEELRFLVVKKFKENPNYELKVCCIEDSGDLGRKIEKLGVEVICLKKSSRPFNFLATIKLWRYLRRNKFDIAQTSLFNANFHGRIAAFFAGVPIIISEEHSEHYQYNSIKFAPFVIADKCLSYLTDRIIPCSNNLMKHIIKLEKIPAAKFFPLVNTFNVDKLKIKIDPAWLKKELGLSENNLIIGNIAALSFRKGQDKLIRAFKLVVNDYPQAKLLFIGNEIKEAKDDFSRLVHSLGLSGNVLFLGQKENIADYINILDVFVLSSNFEGIPLALLEAMYLRKPVVASNIGGIPEVITHGKNGFLVNAANPQAISRAVIQLLADQELKKRIINDAFETVNAKFDTQSYCNKLENLYTDLLREKNAAFAGRD